MAALRRDLGLLEATTIVIGSMIGSGIFFVPNLVAREFPDPPTILGLWLLGAVFSMAGALTVAELAALYPRAGGPYDFIREAFGPGPGFLSGWAYFLTAKAGIGAAVAVVFAAHLAYFRPYDPWQLKFLAVWILAATTFVNWLGVRLAGQVQNILTFLKAGSLLLIVGAAVVLLPDRGAPVALPEPGGRFTVAFLPVLFAYNAWINATFVAEEVRNPERNLPRALALGVGGVALLYLAANAAYLAVLGPEGVAASSVVATDAAAALFAAGGTIIAVAVLVSTGGNIHGGILTGARLPLALARDDWLPPRMARLSRFATPGAALILQLILAATIVVTGTFERIVSFSIFVVWGVLLLVGLALFRLRRTRPNARRPYRVPLYPLTPALFVLAALFVLVLTLIEQPSQALWGLGIAATGLPLYLVAAARRRRARR